MKPQKWKAIVLCLVLVAGITAYLTSRERFMPGVDSTPVTPAPTPSNAPATLAADATEVLTLEQPASKTPREEIVGVGLMLRADSASHEVMSAGLVPNSPASEAGLVGRIFIRKIDEIPTSGMTMRECVERLRGIAGSKVRLEVFDADANEMRTVELTRRKLQIRAKSPERER